MAQNQKALLEALAQLLVPNQPKSRRQDADDSDEPRLPWDELMAQVLDGEIPADVKMPAAGQDAVVFGALYLWGKYQRDRGNKGWAKVNAIAGVLRADGQDTTGLNDTLRRLAAQGFVRYSGAEKGLIWICECFRETAGGARPSRGSNSSRLGRLTNRIQEQAATGASKKTA